MASTGNYFVNPAGACIKVVASFSSGPLSHTGKKKESLTYWRKGIVINDLLASSYDYQPPLN